MPLYSSKSRKADEPVAESLVTVGLLDDAAAEPLLPLTAAADAVRFAARLVDTPPAEMTTTHFRSEARETAKLLGARVTYLEVVGEELRDRGFGGIWGVGKAAMEPPALVVLSFTPEDADPALKPVALVGKGIIYDTGGLSLKVGGGMVGMKVRALAASAYARVTDSPCVTRGRWTAAVRRRCWQRFVRRCLLAAYAARCTVCCAWLRTPSAQAPSATTTSCTSTAARAWRLTTPTLKVAWCLPTVWRTPAST
jgi:hypothetical protein